MSNANATEFDVDQFIEAMLAEDRGAVEPEPTQEEYSRFHREMIQKEEEYNRAMGVTSHYDPRWT